MHTIGIDPGPDSYAWARYDGADIVAWGECAVDTLPDTPLHGLAAVGIEAVMPYGPRVPFGQSTRRTCECVGAIGAMFRFATGREPERVGRKRIAADLAGSARAGDKGINAVIGRLCPAFAVKHRGLNGHHRAAAAVAVWLWNRFGKL